MAEEETIKVVVVLAVDIKIGITVLGQVITGKEVMIRGADTGNEEIPGIGKADTDLEEMIKVVAMVSEEIMMAIETEVIGREEMQAITGIVAIHIVEVATDQEEMIRAVDTDSPGIMMPIAKEGIGLEEIRITTGMVIQRETGARDMVGMRIMKTRDLEGQEMILTNNWIGKENKKASFDFKRGFFSE